MKSWIFIICALFATPAGAADSVDDVRKVRLRAGAWAGSSVSLGSLSLASDSAQSEVRIDGLPSIDLGLEVWPTESVGVYWSSRIGLGADITSQDAYLVGDPNAIGNLRGATIAYNLHQLEAGARLRWLAGPRADAVALVWGWGARLLIQTAQDQRPSILLDRLVAGPETSLGVEWPLLRQVWLRFSGRVGAPFFVRESPNDSGDLDAFVQFGTQAEIVLHLTSEWALQVYLDFEQTKLGFEGAGSRGAGLTNADTESQFLSSGLWARYTGL